jgi:hypothetical protein
MTDMVAFVNNGGKGLSLPRFKSGKYRCPLCCFTLEALSRQPTAATPDLIWFPVFAWMPILAGMTTVEV